jgi:hypothetical protein
MLSEADRPFIERVVGPFSFVIENGAVRVIAPADGIGLTRGRAAELSAAELTPQQIEARVNHLKVKAHRWAIAPAFVDHFVLYDNIVIQAGLYANAPMMGPWRKWLEEFQTRMDAAASANAVAPPDWPPIPDWFRWTDGLRDLADRIGHPDARK